MNLEFLKAQVNLLAEDEFDSGEVLKLLAKVEEVLGPDILISDYLFQISRDKGLELEIGLFDRSNIFDFTLSNDQVFHCKQALKSINNTEFFIGKGKSTLKIFGEIKLDYNVVMPDSPNSLINYQNSLKKAISEL